MSVDSDLGYAAGIIDGEGTIAITQGQKEGRRRHHQLYSRVTTADLVITPFMYDMFGGNLGLRLRNCKPENVNASDVLDWHIFGHESLEFLRRVQPFVKLKHQHVQLALEFGKTLLRKGGNKHHPVPLESVAIREELYGEMKELNRRDGSLRLIV